MTRLYHKVILIAIIMSFTLSNTYADSNYKNYNNNAYEYFSNGNDNLLSCNDVIFCIYVDSANNYILSVYNGSSLVHEVVRNIGVGKEIPNVKIHEINIPDGIYTVTVDFGYFDSKDKDIFHTIETENFHIEHGLTYEFTNIENITKTITETNVIVEEKTKIINETDIIEETHIIEKTIVYNSTEIETNYTTNVVNQTYYYSSEISFNGSNTIESDNESLITAVNLSIVWSLTLGLIIVLVKKYN